MQALRRALTERAKPSPRTAQIRPDMRLSRLAEIWLAHLEDEGRIELSTLNEYRRTLHRTVLPKLGGLLLREVTTGALDQFLIDVWKTSPNRQRKSKAVLGGMLDMAVRHDALTHNPIRGTTALRRPRATPRVMTIEDLETVRAAVHAQIAKPRPGPKANHDMADIVDLMLATGCRIGEILALRWSDLHIDADPPTVTVAGTIKTEPGRGTYRKPTPKTDHSNRTLVLPPFAVQMLRRRRANNQPNDVDAVFATRTGTWHQLSNIERRWRQIRAGTGLEWVTPHMFRKTVATSSPVNRAPRAQRTNSGTPRPDHPRVLHRQAGHHRRRLRHPADAGPREPGSLRASTGPGRDHQGQDIGMSNATAPPARPQRSQSGARFRCISDHPRSTLRDLATLPNCKPAGQRRFFGRADRI